MKYVAGLLLAVLMLTGCKTKEPTPPEIAKAEVSPETYTPANDDVRSHEIFDEFNARLGFYQKPNTQKSLFEYGYSFFEKGKENAKRN